MIKIILELRIQKVIKEKIYEELIRFNSIREYIKSKNKDLIRLSKYADKMGIKKEVMDFVEVFYE